MADDRLARALGSRIRRDMLHLLFNDRSCVQQLADSLGISEVNASKHLTKLYDLGLLLTSTEGRKRYYSLKVPEIKSLIEQYNLVARKMIG